MNNFLTLIFNTKEKNRKKIEKEKSIIRKNIKSEKLKITSEEKNLAAEKTFNKLEKLPEFQKARNVLMYWSMPDELPTHDFVVKWSETKQMLLPVVKDNDMLIKPFSSKKELQQGKYGIWEPDVQKEFFEKIDLVIVPGIAFDKQKSRLGRGKGYYDKYLNSRELMKIGICYDFQLLNEIPTDLFDVKMDKIITPSEIIE